MHLGPRQLALLAALDRAGGHSASSRLLVAAVNAAGGEQLRYHHGLRALAQLESYGLVRRLDAGDRRPVALTPAGRSIARLQPPTREAV